MTKNTKIDLMNLAPRCLAKNRKGSPCQAPAMRGKRRCRLHGGKSTGAPKGSQNALKHGRYTAEAAAQRRAVRDLIRASNQQMKEY
jgi:hypothetical protein